MAQKGKGKKIRFQGGSVFPIALLVVVALGALLVVYARQSIDSKAAGPQASKLDHWHIAYGFYVCDTTGTGTGADLVPSTTTTVAETTTTVAGASTTAAASTTTTVAPAATPDGGKYLGNLVGNIETSSKYLATGVHSHDDGVIHWHPSSAAASGRNARIKVFLNNYDVSLSDSKLTFPAGQDDGLTFEEGTTKCKENGKTVDGQLKVFVWPQSSDPSKFSVSTANLSSTRILENGMAITIAFVPEDVTSIPEPPTAAKLPELGAVDTGGTTTTVAGAITVAGDTTVPGATTVAGETTIAGSATTTPSGTTAVATGTTVATATTSKAATSSAPSSSAG